MRYKVLIPTIGACAAYVAALDAHLGAGAVELLLELCFSDASADSVETSLPMKHSAHTLSFLAVGSAFASFAFFAASREGVGLESNCPQDFSDIDINLVAALSMLANACDEHGHKDICNAYKRVYGNHLDIELAAASYDLFSLETIEEDLHIFVDVSDPFERARIICTALDYSQRACGSDELFEVVDAIADAMEMDVAEIAKAQATFVRSSEKQRFGAGLQRLGASFARLSIVETAGRYQKIIGEWICGFRVAPTEHGGLFK